MASIFKLPQLATLPQRNWIFPFLNGNNLQKKKSLEAAVSAQCTLESILAEWKVVAKKTKCDSVDWKSHFIKEAGLLNAKWAIEMLLVSLGFARDGNF